MVLTCNRCPVQIAFAGKNARHFAKVFGWTIRKRHYFCGFCA